MIESNPQYRISYRLCNHSPSHEGEKQNLVCLNEKCVQNSLICSMCRQDLHKNHHTQPLKFYIEKLRKDYKSENRDYAKELETLQEDRVQFLVKLRESVEKIALEFQKLEQQVILRFDSLRQQIYDEQSKRKKFDQFYQSLTVNSTDNPEFLIQNYLPTKKIENIENIEIFSDLGKKLSSSVAEIRSNIFSSNVQIQPVVIDVKKQSLASSVAHVGTIYTQKNQNIANLDCLNALTLNVLKQFQNKKIKIKVTKVKKGALIYIGAIEKELFQSLKNKRPLNWQVADRVFWVHNSVGSFGHKYSTLKTFSQNSNLQVTFVGNTMKVAMKKHFAEFTIPTEKEFYFFFSLQGPAEISLVQLLN